MKTSKIDRRVNRTRRLLREALFSLIMEMGYDAITIEQITNRADLGRTTFYLHYRDKEDLLLESIETIADDLRSQVELYIQEQGNTSIFTVNPILLVFRHAAENAPLYRIILRGGAANSVLSRIREILGEAGLEFFQQRFASLKSPPDQAPRIPAEVLVHAFAASLLGLMTWWLEGGMQYTPEQISLYFRDLFFNGALDVLGGRNIQFPLSELPQG